MAARHCARYDLKTVSTNRYRVLSLTTDYGFSDGFVAACHGVSARDAPDTRVIDVSHAVPPGDIRYGAAIMAQTLPYLPLGAHVGVVDPGVGTTRRPVAIETESGVLVGPDNGLLLWAAEALGGAQRAMALTNSRLHRHPTSHTFHGRDIFVPVAAALLAGTPLDDAGEPVALKDLVQLPEPVIDRDENGFCSEILTIDRFGNLQLAARGDILDGYGERFDILGRAATRGDMFAAAEPGELVVLIDSAGHAAVSVNGASAANVLDVRPGEMLRLDAT